MQADGKKDIQIFCQTDRQTGRQADRQVTMLGDVGDASLHSRRNFSTKLYLVVQRRVVIGYRWLRRCFLIGQNIFQMDQPRLAAVVIFKSQMNIPTPGQSSTVKLYHNHNHNVKFIINQGYY